MAATVDQEIHCEYPSDEETSGEIETNKGD